MKEKIIAILLLSFLSTNLFAHQFNQLSIQQNLTSQKDMPFEFTRPIIYLVPLLKTKETVTFYVDKVTPLSKKSDTLTVFCNNIELKIHAGETGVCNVVQTIPSYFGVTDEDFKNGSFGKLIFS